MTAIIPGSFDPLTTGHFDLILRAARIFESVTVLVCVNYEKEYTFTHEERVEIARAAFSDFKNINVEMHSGWLYEYVDSHKPCVLVKGIRNSDDYEYEKRQAEFNRSKTMVETLYLDSDLVQKDTSSTKVRELLKSGGDWRKLVPQNAQKTVEKFYKKI